MYILTNSVRSFIMNNMPVEDALAAVHITPPNDTSLDIDIRSPDVWFEDGDCILQAENTLFKLYSGVLSKYSGFFRTLLTLPQPKHDEEIYEDRPIIRLQGDTASAATHFLSALMDLRCVNHNHATICDI